MPSTFELTSEVPLPLAMDRLTDLLTRKGVKLQVNGPQIQSLDIPIILWNWSKFKYSRSNWFGLNPFVQISGIVIQAQPSVGTGTKLRIQLNQLRGYVAVALPALTGVSIAFLPEVPIAAKIFFLGVVPGICWIIQLPLMRHLIRREMRNALMSGED